MNFLLLRVVAIHFFTFLWSSFGWFLEDTNLLFVISIFLVLISCHLVPLWDYFSLSKAIKFCSILLFQWLSLEFCPSPFHFLYLGSYWPIYCFWVLAQPFYFCTLSPYLTCFPSLLNFYYFFLLLWSKNVHFDWLLMMNFIWLLLYFRSKACCVDDLWLLSSLVGICFAWTSGKV